MSCYCNRIQSLLSTSTDRGHDIQYLWIPSHIGLIYGHLDKLAKKACLKPKIDLNLRIKINVVKSVLTSVVFEDLPERMRC